jgi:hypothetical protein
MLRSEGTPPLRIDVSTHISILPKMEALLNLSINFSKCTFSQIHARDLVSGVGQYNSMLLAKLIVAKSDQPNPPR